MRPYIVRALYLRCVNGTVFDNGRIAELLVFPVSFLVIWGLFFRSGIVEKNVAAELLVISLIWSLANTFQMQTNLSLMFDLWAREFAHILRQGVRPNEMALAQLLFGASAGFGSLMIFSAAIPLFFDGGTREIRLLLLPFPIYFLASMGLALFFAGIVIQLGRTYAFLSWTGLQVIIMFSSPYAPLQSLPDWFQAIALLSPYTYAFEYVRNERPADYITGLIVAIAILLLGAYFARKMFLKRRQRDGLVGV